MLRPTRRPVRAFSATLLLIVAASLILSVGAVGRVAQPDGDAAVTAGAGSERAPRVVAAGVREAKDLQGGGPVKALDDLPSATTRRPDATVGAEGGSSGRAPSVPAPAAVQATSSGAPAVTSTGWEGLDEAIAGFEPPDPWVAVGPNDVVQTVNKHIRRTNRAGVTTTADTPLYDFFAFDTFEVEGQPIAIDGLADPHFTYDGRHDRWLGLVTAWHCDTDGSASGDFSSSYLVLALSLTSDPNGDWYFVVNEVPGFLLDFPTLGTSSDKVVLASNEFAFDSAGGCISTAEFDAASMFAFTWAELQTFSAFPEFGYTFSFDHFSFRPAIAPQSSSADVHVVAEQLIASPTDSNVSYLRITGIDTGGDPLDSIVFDGPHDLSDAGVVPAFVDPPTPVDPGGPIEDGGVSAVDRRPTDAVWREDVLTFASTYPCDPAGGGAENRACARVTQVDTSTAIPTRVQDMLIASTGKDSWFPGVGQNQRGALHVVYSQSSSSEGISSYARYQLTSDAIHTLSTPLELADGGSTAYAGTRWGDYVGVAQDPRDTNAVWQGNQYTKSNGTWGTHVSELQTAGATFHPIDPVRVLDSRFNNGLNGKFSANVPRTVDVAGRLGIPDDAIAITGNVTIVGQSVAGYAAITPTPDPNPPTSSLNFPSGDNRGNNFTIPLGPSGGVSIVYKAANGNTAHFIVDVTGYFLEDDSGATYKILTPLRVLDTRFGTGLSGAFPANQNREFQVRGVGAIPNDAIAVTGNLAVVSPTGAGYVSLATTPPPSLPATSSINFPAGDIRANGITIRLSATGTIWAVYKAVAGHSAHLVFDVTGYYVDDLTGARFVPLAPGRRLDTRFPAPPAGITGVFTANTPRTLLVEPYQGVPVSAIAVTGNVTVVGQTRAGYLTMTPDPNAAPPTATLNFPVGDIRGNGVTGPLNGAGQVSFVYKANGGTTHLVFDLTGYFR